MTVRDTTSEARIEVMYATPSGEKIFPSMPLKANRGRNTRMTMMVAKTMELRTSLEASKITVMTGRGAELAILAYAAKDVSTSTMASSTSSPMAIARPQASWC